MSSCARLHQPSPTPSIQYRRSVASWSTQVIVRTTLHLQYSETMSLGQRQWCQYEIQGDTVFLNWPQAKGKAGEAGGVKSGGTTHKSLRRCHETAATSTSGTPGHPRFKVITITSLIQTGESTTLNLLAPFFCHFCSFAWHRGPLSIQKTKTQNSIIDKAPAGPPKSSTKIQALTFPGWIFWQFFKKRVGPIQNVRFSRSFLVFLMVCFWWRAPAGAGRPQSDLFGRPALDDTPAKAAVFLLKHLL